jgi:hypothetical protein
MEFGYSLLDGLLVDSLIVILKSEAQIIYYNKEVAIKKGYSV